jgi:quercetin dioxygenase-like cupin family protein
VGAENFALRRFTLKPGGYTPYHQHAFEHLNYIIAGEGALKNEAGELQPLAAGDFAIVHPNDKHQFVNTGEVDFIFICGVTRDYE